MENVEARTAVTGTTTKIRSFLHGNNLSNKSEDADMDDFMYKDEPIADFFAESTVMFGDVQGVSSLVEFKRALRESTVEGPFSHKVHLFRSSQLGPVQGSPLMSSGKL